jgi:hypothetical protein
MARWATKPNEDANSRSPAQSRARKQADHGGRLQGSGFWPFSATSLVSSGPRPS